MFKFFCKMFCADFVSRSFWTIFFTDFWKKACFLVPDYHISYYSRVSCYPGILVSCYPGVLVFGFPGILVSGFPGILVSWYPGILVSWYPGVLVSWYPGILVSWYPWYPVSYILYSREFQLLMTDNDLQVNLENLMGNGLGMFLLSLHKYQSFAPSCCKDLGFEKFEFVAKSQLLLILMN